MGWVGSGWHLPACWLPNTPHLPTRVCCTHPAPITWFIKRSQPWSLLCSHTRLFFKSLPFILATWHLRKQSWKNRLKNNARGFKSCRPVQLSVCYINFINLMTWVDQELQKPKQVKCNNKSHFLILKIDFVFRASFQDIRFQEKLSNKRLGSNKVARVSFLIVW